MKKRTYRWLFIGTTCMLIVAGISAVVFQNVFEKGNMFLVASALASIMAIIYLFEIKSSCFGGLKPKISWKLRIVRAQLEEKGDTETYLRIIKQIVRCLLIFAAVFFILGLIKFAILALKS